MDGGKRRDRSSKTDDAGSAGRSYSRDGDSIATVPEYEAVFDTIEDAVFVFDVEYDEDGVSFSFRRNNPAHEEITNVTVDEFRGDSPEEILGEKEGAEVAANFRRCVETEDTIEYEETIDLPAGTVEWHTKLTPLFEDGEVTRIIGVARDITDRKQRERELTRQRKRLQALFDEAPDGVIVHDADGEILDVNGTICEQLGYTREELLSMDVFDLDVSLEEEAIKTEWQSMDPGSMHRLEVEGCHRRKDGSTFPVEVWVSKVRSNGPESTRFVALIRDITERKERERELERYEELWTDLPIGVGRADSGSGGEILRANDRLVDVAGASSKDELLGQPLADLWAATEDRETFLERLETEGVATTEARFERLDGRPIWGRITAFGKEKNGSTYTDFVVQDITDRRDREIHLEKAQEVGNIGWWRKEIPSDTIYWSEHVYEMWGAEGSGLIDHERFMEFIHPEDEEDVDRAWQAAKEGEPYDIEHRIVTGDGETRWMREKAELTFENGQPVSAVGIVQDISERKERERELERYEEIVENASDVLWMFRDDLSETLFINQPYEEIFGQSTAALQDDPLAFIEATHPDDRELMRQQVERISSGSAIDFELRVNPQEDFGRWVWIKGTPIYDEGGDQYAVSGFVRDITELKEQRRQIQQFKEAIEQAAHAVYITDTDGDIEYVNPAFEEITGYAESEAMGETPNLLKSGEHDEQLYEELWETILDGRRWHNEMIDRRKDGERIVLDQTISPLRNEDSEIKKFVAVARDVTERKERERALQRHRTYLESANDMITLIEPDGTIEYVSPAVERILGFEPEELIGENGFEYVHPEDRTERIEDIEELVESPGEETVLEFRFRQADGGYRWIESTARDLLDDPDVEGLLLSSRDITDRKEYEQRLSTLHDTTRRIIDAESKRDVAEITVDAAQDLLEFSLPSVWYPNEGGTELKLVANSEKHRALLEEADTPDPTHPADSWMWDVIESDETVVRSPIPTEDLAADVPIQSAIILPLGGHGVLGCGVEGEHEFSDREVRIAEVLAQNVRTALGQLDQREALERQKAFTDDLLDAIDDVVYVLDTDGDLEQWNVALEEVTGYQHDEIDSMNAADFFAEEDAEVAREAVEESFETGRTRVELEFLTAEGESIPYEFIANTFENPAGEPVMAGIGRDRSVHVEYEETLEEERDFFERTIESLPYPFYVLDADDYTIEHTNSLANVSEGETCYEVTHNRKQPCDEGERSIACPLSDVSELGEPVSVEHIHYDEDGNERVYQVYAAPIFDAEGNVVQMAESNIDVTERVEYEQQLEEQRDNLSVLNQVVRHDIRNDMTVVKGRANLLDEHVDPAGREDLEAVLEATENAIELTKTARDLSETMLSTEEDVESVRLDRHLAPPIENARSKFDDAIITVEDRIPEVTVRGNGLLEAVFRNLIQNAVIHNDKDAPNVQISTTVDEGTLTVAVADNGPGVPDDQKETIFGKGEKGLDSPGTGIGLYLVRTLVDQYGGDVWVEDDEPEGSVFYVELPRSGAATGR